MESPDLKFYHAFFQNLPKRANERDCPGEPKRAKLLAAPADITRNQNGHRVSRLTKCTAKLNMPSHRTQSHLAQCRRTKLPNKKNPAPVNIAKDWEVLHHTREQTYIKREDGLEKIFYRVNAGKTELLVWGKVVEKDHEFWLSVPSDTPLAVTEELDSNWVTCDGITDPKLLDYLKEDSKEPIGYGVIADDCLQLLIKHRPRGPMCPPCQKLFRVVEKQVHREDHWHESRQSETSYHPESHPHATQEIENPFTHDSLIAQEFEASFTYDSMDLKQEWETSFIPQSHSVFWRPWQDIEMPFTPKSEESVESEWCAISNMERFCREEFHEWEPNVELKPEIVELDEEIMIKVEVISEDECEIIEIVNNNIWNGGCLTISQ